MVMLPVAGSEYSSIPLGVDDRSLDGLVLYGEDDFFDLEKSSWKEA